jgi:hypothetical protein
MRRKDAMLMCFFSGAIIMILLMTALVLSIPDEKNEEWKSNLIANLPTFRFIFMLIFVLVSTAVAIRIFRSYKINYLFIFDLDPHYKMTHVQIFRVSIPYIINNVL